MQRNKNDRFEEMRECELPHFFLAHSALNVKVAVS